MIHIEDIKDNKAVRTYIQKADEAMMAMGYTEHSFAHVSSVAKTAKKILLTFGYSEREAELAEMAGYLHDIGNVVNRENHSLTGAVMAFRILDKLGADPEEASVIISAIGNHDESNAFPVNPVAAALFIADKSDVRYTRVRNKDISSFDIHDRVNYAVKERSMEIVKDSHIQLNLRIDTQMCSIADYFEIFLTRMTLCKRACSKLGVEFRLVMNDQRVI